MEHAPKTSKASDPTSPKSTRARHAEYQRQKADKGNKRKKHKKKSPDTTTSATFPITQTLLSKAYLINRFNLLRVIILIVAAILLIVCILYGLGSILTLSLKDFWCPEYSWDEISSYNRLNNESTGIGGCYVSPRLTLDFEKLTQTDVNKNALKVTTNVHSWGIIKLLVFFSIALTLLYLLLKYCLVSLIDCKKTYNGDWYVFKIY